MSDLEQEYKIAEKRPFELWLKSFFANRSLIILAVCFFSLLIALQSYLFEGGFWGILNIVAVAISVVGFCKTLTELSKIEIENALIGICRKRGSEYLESNEREDISKLFKKLSIENESHPAINRLINHIIGEARMNKFDTGTNLLEPYKDESLDIIFSLQNFQKIALWIGIAGTFIGILKAINDSDFQNILSGEKINELIKVIPRMFTGLQISFSASLAGLFSAVFISWLILIIRKKQQSYFQRLEGVVNIIIASARQCRYESKFLNEIDTLREDLNTSQRTTIEIQNSNYQLQGLISNLQETIIRQNLEIKLSVDQFLETNKKIYSISEATKEEVNYVHNSTLLKSALQESIESASHQMSAAISQRVAILTEKMTAFTAVTEKFNSAVQSHGQMVKSSNEQMLQINKGLGSSLNNVSSAIKNLKSPQNWAIWVVGVIILAAIIGGVFGMKVFSPESIKSTTGDSGLPSGNVSNSSMNLTNKANGNKQNVNTNRRF